MYNSKTKKHLSYKIKKHVLYKCLVIFLLQLFFFTIFTSNLYPQKKNVYYIGYSSNLFRGFNIYDARAAASILENAIVKQGAKFYKTEAVKIDDPNDISHLIMMKKLDFISMTSIEYLEIRGDGYLYPFVAPVAKDSVLNRLLLLVNQDSNISSIKDLRGKSISTSSEYYENYKLPTIWLKYLLWKNKIKDGGNFLGNLKVSSNPSLIANEVFFKTTDACIIYESEFETLKELNPQIGEKLVVMETSIPYITDVGCYTINCKNSSQLKDILEVTYSLNSNLYGKSLLRMLKVKQLVPYKKTYMYNVEQLYQEYNNYLKLGYK